MIYGDIYAKLVADATIIAALSTYQGAPAIISSPVELTDLECPYLLIEQVSGGGPTAEPRCLRGWTETVQISAVDDRIQSGGTLADLMHAVFDVLDRSAVNETGWRGWLTCTGPQFFTDADGFPGARLTVTAELWT
jgi:hypothetical protein